MKKLTKFIAVSAILSNTAFLFTFGCKKGAPQSAHEHFYDDEYDATCNGCPYIRVPTQRPEQKPEGFVVDELTDGLIVEGLSSKYTLSESMPAFNFNDVEIKVYLASGEVKGKAVPDENFCITLTYGDELINDCENLTAEGEYVVTVTLLDEAYVRGNSTKSDKITAEITFEIANPITQIRFKSGTVSQYVSKTDKMSASWIFEGVRANGEVEEIGQGNIGLSEITTETTGTHCATANYNGVEIRVEYTVLPQPEVIKGVEVGCGDYEKFVKKGETLKIDGDDIEVLITANGGYEYDGAIQIIYGGNECTEVQLSARAEEYVLTVKSTLTYVIENETVTKIFENHIRVKVSEIPEVPENSDLVIDGEIIGGLPADIVEETVLAESGKGCMKVCGGNGATLSAGECAAVEIDGNVFTNAISVNDNDFQTFRGFGFSIEEPAELTVYLSADDFATVSAEGATGTIDGADFSLFAGNPTVVKIYFDRAGEYSLVLFGNVKIYRIAVVFCLQ